MIAVEDQTGSTYNRGDFTATNAFFWSSLNLSAFSGYDSGNTPHYISVVDGAGKIATGFIGAVGAGETLSGAELVVNGTMELDSDWDTYSGPGTNERSDVQKHGEAYSRHVSGTNYMGIQTSATIAFALNKLYKVVGYLYVVTNAARLVRQDSTSFPYTGAYKEAMASWQESAGYVTCPLSGNSKIIAHGSQSVSSNEFYVDDVSIQQVTDPPATAVHIVSAQHGSTRAWENIESGFNPNTITTWTISLIAPVHGSGLHLDMGLGMT